MNIVAYCRVSTETDDQLNSLNAQKNFFLEYANKNNYNLVKVYADEGISGTKIKNRIEFKKLLKDADEGIFNMVVVKDISRFARNTVDFLQSIRKLKSLEIETQFLTSNQTVLGNSEFALTIFSAMAQEESANTSKRVKFGKEINAKKGRVPNIVYGYDKIKGDYFNLKINEEEKEVIKRIFGLYIKNGYGANKIAGILTKENIKTKRGYKFSQNAVIRILTNEIYTGKVINGKEEIEDFLTSKRNKKNRDDWHVVYNESIKIVDNNIFEKARKILTERNDKFKNYGQRQSNKHLFSTLIKCSNCGYSFRKIERKYKNKYSYWVCSGRNINGVKSCNNKIKIDENELKTELQNYFINILKTKTNVMKNIIYEFNKIYDTEDNNINTQKDLKNKIEKMNKSRKKNMDMYEDDLITRAELKEKVENINNKIKIYENKLKLIKYNLSKGENLENILNTIFKQLDDIVTLNDMTNTQLKKIIEKIEINKNGEIIVYLKLLNDISI